jgi:hypothetical protein
MGEPNTEESMVSQVTIPPRLGTGLEESRQSRKPREPGGSTALSAIPGLISPGDKKLNIELISSSVIITSEATAKSFTKSVVTSPRVGTLIAVDESLPDAWQQQSNYQHFQEDPTMDKVLTGILLEHMAREAGVSTLLRCYNDGNSQYMDIV